MTRTVANTSGSYRVQARGGSREPPAAACTRPRAVLGVRNLECTQGIPTNVVTRLRGRWTCPVHRPASSRAPEPQGEGVRHGAWVANEHRSVRAQSGRFGGLGMGFARSWLLLRGPMVIPGSATRRGRAWLRGVPGVQETAAGCFLHGVTRCFPRNSTVFSRVFAASARNPALNNCNIRAIQKEPPHWAGEDGLS